MPDDSARRPEPSQTHDDSLGETKTEVALPSPGRASTRDPERTFEEQAVVANRFRILRFLARGGMGEVYEAHDLELDTAVALKTIRPGLAANTEFIARFKQEINLARQITHPNVCRVFDFFSHREGERLVSFLTMELIRGETLAHAIRSRGPLRPEDAQPLAVQMAQALQAAHDKGVVHRDFKSANVMLEGNQAGGQRRVVVTDFGLAASTTPGRELENSGVVGTPDYMAPEQVEGRGAGPAADIYALGVVLFEMVTGALPFSGSTPLDAAKRRLTTPPPAPRSVRPGLDPAWDRTVLRCLERDPQRRFPSARAVAEALAPFSWRPWVIRGTVAAALMLAAAGAYLGWRAMQERRLRAEFLHFVEHQQNAEAFLLALRQPSVLLPGQLDNISRITTFESTPPGAEVSWKPYETPGAAWQTLGRTPLRNVRVPFGGARLRLSLAGYESFEGVLPQIFPFAGAPPLRFPLNPAGSTPKGMLAIPGGPYNDRIIPGNNPVRRDVPGFEIDQFEVTNRQFQAFVDAGGYSNSAYWKIPFIRDGRPVKWEEARVAFRDSSGQPGPATWVRGRYPEGQPDHPVGGVSWYEAAAYASWAGKSLPSIFHWRKAADVSLVAGVTPNAGILRLANFGRKGATAAGARHATTRYGAEDMAGNHREWCWNEEEPGLRYILGGHYGDEPFTFIDPIALSAWDRSVHNGFRCIRSSAALPEQVMAPFAGHLRDLSKETPVGDREYESFRPVFAYEKTPLEVRQEASDTSHRSWVKEKVSFRTSYGNERMSVYLFLPRAAKRPWQAVVFSPWVTAQFVPSSANLVNMEFLDFVIESGRAVVYPVYQGMYERANPTLSAIPRGTAPTSPLQQREITVMRVKDLSRTIDYLETRTDLDPIKRAYYGASLGGNYIPFLAMENRFLATISVEGCILRGDFPRPEADPMNHAPRMKLPFLMLNGRFDSICPVETAQKPFFGWMGTPDKDKKHVLFDTGHFSLAERDKATQEILGWLDRYLGPVH